MGRIIAKVQQLEAKIFQQDCLVQVVSLRNNWGESKAGGKPSHGAPDFPTLYHGSSEKEAQSKTPWYEEGTESTEIGRRTQRLRTIEICD